MSKAWGGVGAWALDAERAEDEESWLAASEPLATAAAPVLAGEPVQNFPSLREAAATKSKKKKKAIPLTLSEFTTGANVGPGAGRRSTSSVESKGLTSEEMLRLPTGPRERSAEELEQSRGFRSYGFVSGTGGSRGWFPNRDREGEWSGGRRPYGGGIDEEQRRGPPPSRASDLDQPSRADEVDNWAATKKSFPAAPAGSGRPDRYSSLGSGSSSRADEVDNWSRGKQTQQFRQSGFGSGFRDSPGPSDSDRWFRGGGAGSLLLNGEKERPKLVLDPPKGDLGVPQEPARNRPSPFGAARPREEVLAEKGMDWRKMDTEIETKKTNRPTSSHSSRPSSVQSSRPGSPGSQAVVPAGVTDEAPKPQPKVNPFGDAKPREVLLEEKGKDWRKIDLELEHHRDDRPETDEEKLLRDEIYNLKKALEENSGNLNDSLLTSEEEITSLRQKIIQKEKDLELLLHELDNKVRFGQRSAGDIRPGFGVSRIATYSDRPPSQSGLEEKTTTAEFPERSRSRGGFGETWSRSNDDKWGFQGTSERSSIDSRNPERSRTSSRW